VCCIGGAGADPARQPPAPRPQVNSIECLGKLTCLPLGGHSVWAAMPPFSPGEPDSKQVTLVVAQVDSLDVFHDLVQVGRVGVLGLGLGLLLLLLRMLRLEAAG
jgi:hypothetical protein